MEDANTSELTWEVYVAGTYIATCNTADRMTVIKSAVTAGLIKQPEVTDIEFRLVSTQTAERGQQ